MSAINELPWEGEEAQIGILVISISVVFIRSKCSAAMAGKIPKRISDLKDLLTANFRRAI
jgi:hypothetical protein